MTQAEAEAVLGGPPGDYRTRPRPRWLPPAPVTPGVWEDAPKVERWEGDDGTAVVAFRPAGTVLRAEFDEPPPFRPGLLELARWRLDKMRAAWGR